VPRIVVVSRNPNLAWGIGAADHDLLEVRPHQIDDWLEERAHEPTDLIVVDVSDSARSLSLLTELRGRAQMAPALLVAGDDAGWDDPEIVALPGAEVLALPVSTQAIQAAMARLLAADAAPLAPTRAPTPAPTATIPAQVGNDQATQADLVVTPEVSQTSADKPLAPDPRQDARATPDVAPPDGALPPLRRSSRTSRAVREALSGANFADQVAQVAKVAQSSATPITDAPHRSAVGETGATADHSPLASPGSPMFTKDRPARTMDSANALARSLTLRIDELYGVPETAEVIVVDAVERVRAEQAALMLPDGRRWRVAAGIGLGGIERRFELDEDSWVIANVARASKGVLVEDTDVARRPFQRAPLASRKHLLAAPIRLVEGVLIVARDTDPGFTEQALADLAHLADEAGLLLAAALDVRDLARRLQPFTDFAD
jgi:hypothetical protein